MPRRVLYIGFRGKAVLFENNLIRFSHRNFMLKASQLIVLHILVVHPIEYKKCTGDVNKFDRFILPFLRCGKM